MASLPWTINASSATLLGVQSLAGSPATLSALTAFLRPRRLLRRHEAEKRSQKMLAHMRAYLHISTRIRALMRAYLMVTMEKFEKAAQLSKNY